MLVLSALVPPAAAVTPEAELLLTWQKGAFMLPAALASRIGAPTGELARIDRFADRLETIRVDRPHPLAVLMHGCFGLGGEQLVQGRLLSERGFVVFMPSHYGRPGTPLLCAGNAAGEVQFARVDRWNIAQRLEELDLALERARRLPFVDGTRTLVIGHSMGGITVGNMKRSDVTATVITGWGCLGSLGARPPPSLPLLAIRFRDDPWQSGSTECDAGPFSGRDAANTVSLMLDGQRSHEVMHDARAVQAIQAYVDRHFGPR